MTDDFPISVVSNGDEQSDLYERRLDPRPPLIEQVLEGHREHALGVERGWVSYRGNVYRVFNLDLPGELTSFIGRRSELTQLKELLVQVRLLTLSGAGGCGKTRLALQTAADALDGYPGGVWWVELARWEDLTLLPAAVSVFWGCGR